MNISHQKIIESSSDDLPDSLEEGDSSVGDLLEDVASIVDSAAPAIAAEVEKEAKRKRGLSRMFKRRRKGGKGKKS